MAQNGSLIVHVYASRAQLPIQGATVLVSQPDGQGRHPRAECFGYAPSYSDLFSFRSYILSGNGRKLPELLCAYDCGGISADRDNEILLIAVA